MTVDGRKKKLRIPTMAVTPPQAIKRIFQGDRRASEGEKEEPSGNTRSKVGSEHDNWHNQRRRKRGEGDGGIYDVKVDRGGH